MNDQIAFIVLCCASAVAAAKAELDMGKIAMFFQGKHGPTVKFTVPSVPESIHEHDWIADNWINAEAELNRLAAELA